MSQNPIMNKILSLLELADRGASEQERMLAAKKAQKLMLQHEISSLELDDQANPQPYETTSVEFDGMVNHWKSSLFNVICKAVGVHIHREHVRSGRGPVRLQRIALIGRPDKIEFVQSLANSLIPFLESECERGLQLTIEREVYSPPKPRAYRQGFYAAAVHRIGARLIEQRRASEEEIGDNSMALVRRDDKALKAFVESEHGKMHKAYSRQTVDRRGQSAGREAGNRSSIRPNRNLATGQRQLTA